MELVRQKSFELVQHSKALSFLEKHELKAHWIESLKELAISAAHTLWALIKLTFYSVVIGTFDPFEDMRHFFNG